VALLGGEGQGPGTGPAESGPVQVTAAPNLTHGDPIRFLIHLDRPGRVRLVLFSLAGEEVYGTQAQGNAGGNVIPWDLRGPSGSPVASGLYLYVVSVENHEGTVTRAGKVAVLR